MFENISERLKERAQKIKMIGFDVDGVLTDGSLYIAKDGELVKRFFALDGHGIKLAQNFKRRHSLCP
jgi:3-deoxy-D-manno-octulosonate 8-phosphate phosphatase (KDO 8-P phosphatase)